MITEAFLQEAINLFAQIFFVILVPLAARWLYSEYHRIKQNLPEEVEYALDSAARYAVYAAEQLNIAKLLELEERKEYAVNVAIKRLREQGYDIDPDVVDASIESMLGQIKFVFDQPEDETSIGFNNGD